MNSRSLALAFAGLALVSLGGCETTVLFPANPENQTPSDGEWQETEPLAATSFDLLWQRTRATLEDLDYQIDDNRTHVDDRVIVTKWNTIMAMLRFDGVRRRAHVEFVPAEDGRWVIRCAVIKQRNADIDDPTNPVMAQWEDAGPDPGRTGRLLYRLRGGLMDAPAK